jgi:hypothetical protein
MDFYAVLDQVLELLRQRGRVTYNALKRQFELDDACLQDLKDEIIEAQRVAVDSDATPRAGQRRTAPRWGWTRPTSRERGGPPGRRGGNGLREAGGRMRRCYDAESRHRPADGRGSTRRTVGRRKQAYG